MAQVGINQIECVILAINKDNINSSNYDHRFKFMLNLTATHV
jgi:hypothetical protein